MWKVRLLKHSIIVNLLLISVLLTGGVVISSAVAAVNSPPSLYLSSEWILASVPEAAEPDRGFLSTRTQPRPSPLPTPVAVEPWGLSWPVAGHLTTRYANGHWAVDIGAKCGTTVTASMDGVVKFAGWKNNGGGNVVDVQHDWGIVTSYNHMQAISVTKDQVLVRGQKVGEVGNTGHAIGCHLHWGVAVNGRWVNPLGLLR